MEKTAKQWVQLVRSGEYDFLFSQGYIEHLSRSSDSDLAKSFDEMLGRPIQNFAAYDFYYYVNWYRAMKNVASSDEIRVLEVASGSTDIIPQVMDKSFSHASVYISANANKELTEGLYENTKGLSLAVKVIEDDAKNIVNHVGPDFFDMVVFHHGSNDVIQAILCDKEGIDTIYSDWMEVLPQMIEIMQRERDNGTLEAHAKPEFLQVLDACLQPLKTEGYIIINHHMFQLDLDWGYPYDIWENIIPMVRKWVRESDLPVEEVEFDGFDRQWWMYLKKI